MNTVSTVVFGDDDSPGADIAWLWLSSHRWSGWRLEAVHAFVPEVIKVGQRQELARWRPPAPRRHFADSCFAQVDDLRVDADPRLALSRHADLLVIGARGKGMLKALHLGSTAEWLLARPPSPMVIARTGRPTRKVLVCHDGSVHADAAVQALTAMPWAPGLAVTILHVEDAMQDEAPSFDDASARIRAAGMTVHTVTTWGDPAEELQRWVWQHEPDLIVLGTQGRTGVGRLVAGSTATTLIHTTDRTVLVAHANDA